MSMSRAASLAVGLCFAISSLACAPANPESAGSGGASSTGGSGAGQTGGASGGSGGALGTGSGGSSTTGTGGSNSSTGSGGATGSSGGATSTGGSSASTGGSSASTGGATASGGSPGGTGTGGGAATGTGGGSAAGGQGGSTTCPSGTFICEDFEAYATGAAPTGIWSKDTRSNGTITVDATRAFRGTKSLHVTATMNQDAAHITTPVSITANTTFVRFMMYTVGYPSSSGVHSRLARLGIKSDSGVNSAYSLSSYNGTAIEKVDSIYMRSTSTKLNDASLKNKWICIEFEIDKTGGAGNVKPHLWIDGSELTLAAAGSSSHTGTDASWDPIAFEKFTLGLDGNQTDAVKGDFWVDEVIVASSRVGCPK